MSYCVKCGNQIDEGVKFCPSCGASQSESPARPAAGKAAGAKATDAKAADVKAPGAKAPKSAAAILNKTKSFVVVRALAYLAIMAAMIVVGGIGVFICFSLLVREQFVLAFVVFVIIFGGFFGLLRFARRYFLYMIKAAHIAAITEYLKTGTAPVTENGYKGVIAYGTEKIKHSFMEANIAFVADALIAGATRQIMRWVNKVQRLFSFIPGADRVMQFLNFVLSTALNYIDEAVLSYVFFHDEEKNGFKKACDGLVYYAQAWKGMLMGALKVAAFVWLLRIGGFIVFLVVFTALGNAIFSSMAAVSFIANIFGLILAFIVIYSLEAIIIVPYATCVMINDYYKAIEGQPLKSDLHNTLCGVSRKFRDLFNRSGEAVPEEATNRKVRKNRLPG